MQVFKRPGIYRRRIQIATGPGVAWALLEDDPHCYRVTIEHDGECVIAARCDVIRKPWDLCGQASDNLARLTGMRLSGDALAARGFTDAAQQCTHMFDAASLAIAHAARGIERRRYDISVECFAVAAPRRVQLSIDDELALDAVIEDHVFVAPEHLRGVPAKGLYEWARQRDMAVDESEAIWILRRAIYISSNRLGILDEHEFAIEVSPGMGACFVYQPGVADRARRVTGSTSDFSDGTADMLQWVAVKATASEFPAPSAEK